jgi:hypothetical protein
MKKVISAATLVAGLISVSAATPSTSLAAPSTPAVVNVTRVRTLDNGSIQIQFTGVSCGTGGSYLGVAASPADQADRFVSLATAALLSGRSVEIAYEQVPQGNFCYLTRFALL